MAILNDSNDSKFSFRWNAALSILWNKVVGNVQLARSNQKTQKDWNADTKKDDDYVARIDLLNIKNLYLYNWCRAEGVGWCSPSLLDYSIFTTSPRYFCNLSEGFGQLVRSLRTTCPKPSDNLSGTSGQDEISLKTWGEDGIKGGIRVLLHEKVRIYWSSFLPFSKPLLIPYQLWWWPIEFKDVSFLSLIKWLLTHVSSIISYISTT